jgi:hypothetical protein
MIVRGRDLDKGWEQQDSIEAVKKVAGELILQLRL